MLRTRAVMLAILPSSRTGVVLPGVVANTPAVIAAVLNTHDNDPAVASARRAMQRHQTRLRRLQPRLLPLASHDAQHRALPDSWLTLSIGVPDRLDDALRACKLDAGTAPMPLEWDAILDEPVASSLSLFGVPLRELCSDGSSTFTVGVAALVLRPDMRTAHLITMGPWDASGDAPDVLRALQRLVREHVAQWHLTGP